MEITPQAQMPLADKSLKVSPINKEAFMDIYQKFQTAFWYAGFLVIGMAIVTSAVAYRSHAVSTLQESNQEVSEFWNQNQAFFVGTIAKLPPHRTTAEKMKKAHSVYDSSAISLYPDSIRHAGKDSSVEYVFKGDYNLFDKLIQGMVEKGLSPSVVNKEILHEKYSDGSVSNSARITIKI